MYCCPVVTEEEGSMPPATLLADPGYLLAQAADRRAAILEETLSPFGIRRRHYEVLMTLAESPGSTQQELADRLGIDRTTMAKIADDLEGLGLVHRGSHPKSRRANALELTPSGSRLVPRIARAAQNAAERLFASLPRTKREQLARVLRDVADLPALGRRKPDR
jgi:MarR family transcriptional regulator, lower aerobic nicotinate degradation pathway regulator